MGAIASFADWAIGIFNLLSDGLPPFLSRGIVLVFFALSISVYAWVVYKFYNTLSKKNFISLNLNKYNWSIHPTSKKFFAVIFYFIEYLLIMPALIIVWFAVLSIVLLIMASDRGMEQLLFLSGALILSIRILSYYADEIAKELGKLFPITALVVFLLTPEIFSIPLFFEKLKELPLLFDSIFSFLVFILLFEVALRVIYTIFELAKGKEEVGEEIKVEKF